MPRFQFPTTATEFAEALKRRTSPDILRDAVVKRFGDAELQKGINPLVDNRTVFFALTAPDAKRDPEVVDEAGKPLVRLRKLGKHPTYVASTTLPEGSFYRWQYRVNGEARGNLRELEVYTYPSETRKQPDVPEGKLIQRPPFQSQVFAGTTRDWWLYIPAQYDGTKPACVMVFQDGQWAKNYTPVVFDNLIKKGEMPVTIGIFITPGTFSGGRSNRSVEYDTLSDKYARFLIEEILPTVGREYRLRTDAAGRGIAGISSGGICAFTVAWERSDAFSKVLSWVGSFTNLQGGPSGIGGGHNYPAILRKERGWDRRGAPKPIRVYLQDGANDLDNAAGNWPLANQEMARALEYGGYDYKFVYGQGGHNDKHGRALMPDALRWLWRDVR